MRILFLSRWFPYPPDNGSKIRVYNLLRQLAEGNQIRLLTFHEGEAKISAGVFPPPELQSVCDVAGTFPYPGFRPSGSRALVGALASQPRYLFATFSQELARATEREVAVFRPDVVVVSELPMVPYAMQVKGVPVVLDELELGGFLDAAFKGATLLSRARARLTWWKLAGYLRRVLPRFVACTVVSEVERDAVARVAPSYKPVHIVPNAVDLARYPFPLCPAMPDTLIYAGALTYAANFDAVHHLVREVVPRLLPQAPSARITVTGRTDGVDLAPLTHPSVTFTGHVADVRPLVAGSWASVVPLRRGGGTRLKILESLALGTPVVATRKGVEGLAVSDGENVLIADHPADFARQVVCLLSEPDLRARLATAGRNLVAQRYDWRAVGRGFRQMVEIAASGPASGEQSPAEIARTSGRGYRP